MKYFFDTEFFEDGKTIDLISIGVVAEDGREFYAVNADCDWCRIWNDPDAAWVRENVMPYIDRGAGMSKTAIRDAVLQFIGDDKPEWWAYYADYDWVVLCQVFGRMIDLPKGWPMFCRDLKQLAVNLGNPELPFNPCEHDALSDAHWNREVYRFLQDRNPLPNLMERIAARRIVATSFQPGKGWLEYAAVLQADDYEQLRVVKL